MVTEALCQVSAKGGRATEHADEERASGSGSADDDFIAPLAATPERGKKSSSGLQGEGEPEDPQCRQDSTT